MNRHKVQDGIAVYVIGWAIVDVAFIVVLYDMIYILTAIGLIHDGSSTVHIYTQTIYRIHNEREYTEHEICNNKNI